MSRLRMTLIHSVILYIALMIFLSPSTNHDIIYIYIFFFISLFTLDIHLYPSQQSNRWNNTDMGGNDTDIGWNNTVFFIVITCIPLDRWNDTDIVIPSVEGDTCDSNEENSVILPNISIIPPNISVIPPNISVIPPNISVVLHNISVIPPNISVIPSVEGDTCDNNEENCHPSQSQCYSICREAYILQVMSI